MKSRAFSCLRHAAIAACLVGVPGLALPALAVDSGLTQAKAGRIDLKASSALNRGPVQRPVYGMRFPAGAPAYVRPFRGFLLPRVWVAPTYYIANWQGYGLARPAQGFGWSRYYDDAVLTDRNGRVYDSVQGVNWAPAQAAPAMQAGQAVVAQTYSPDYDPYNYDGDLLLGNDQTVHGTHWARTAEEEAPGVDYDAADNYASAPPPPVAQYDRDYDPAFLEACRRDSGLGGAAIGAAAGGLAGNRIAGRGNRTGGTLIGAGVGAIAGMVIDKAEDRERCKRLLAQHGGAQYGGGYPPPTAQPGGYPPPPPGYYYYYPPPIVTTVTITPGCNCAEEVVTTHTAPARHRPKVYRNKNVRLYRK